MKQFWPYELTGSLILSCVFQMGDSSDTNFTKNTQVREETILPLQSALKGTVRISWMKKKKRIPLTVSRATVWSSCEEKYPYSSQSLLCHEMALGWWDAKMLLVWKSLLHPEQPSRWHLTWAGAILGCSPGLRQQLRDVSLGTKWELRLENKVEALFPDGEQRRWEPKRGSYKKNGFVLDVRTWDQIYLSPSYFHSGYW